MVQEKSINSKLMRKLLAVIIAFAVVITSLIPAATQKAYAADGTISLKVGRVIDYSSWTTHYYYAGAKDNPVFCAQPQMPSPSPGTYSYNFIPADSMLAKCLYYGLGGPGFEDYTDTQLKGQWDGADDAYALTHIVISIAYDKTTSSSVDPFMGLSGTWKTKATNLYNYIKALPDPPINYRAFRIKNSGKQDILGSFNDVGKIKINKSSADKSMTDGNNCYSLAGAKYGVYFGSSLVGTITTDTNGIGVLDDVLVADYTIKEISASKGFALDVASYNCKVQNEATTTVNVKEQPKDDPIGILLEKGDAETGKALPEGGAKLKGAVYEIKYYKNGVSGNILDRTWRVVTDEGGKAYFASKYLDTTFENSEFYFSAAGDPCLPLGTVTVQEVTPPEGYLLNDTIYTAEITEEASTVESVYTYNVPKIGSAEAMAEQPKRGDIQFVKVKDGTMQRLPNVQFKITSKTTGESHTICTDDNGFVDTSSSFNKHKADTNGGTAESGLWFGEIDAIDEEKGALLYDWYTLDEIRGENNKELKLAENVEFRVYRNDTVINLGTVTDDVVKIRTTALDKKTVEHIALAHNPVTFIDYVKYTNFTEGKTYKIVGTLMNRETGKPIEVDGKTITAQKEFVCKDEDGTEELEFTFNALEIGGTNIVVFEKAYDVKTGEEIAWHEDINDDDQRIAIPKIGTKALDEKSKTNVIDYQGKQTIVDTISYEKLLPGKEYTIKTWLVDKYGFKLGDTKVVETKFTPKEEDGTVEVKISFDGEKLAGKTAVVFEEIYLDQSLIAIHKDVKDDKQTVTITAPASSPKTGDKTHVLLWLAAALGALLLASIVIIEDFRRKHKKGGKKDGQEDETKSAE